MARGQIWQNFPKLLRFMALPPSLFETILIRNVFRPNGILKVREHKMSEKYPNTTCLLAC